MHSHDPLYSLFEHHLLNALVEDDSTDDFVAKVVKAYLFEIQKNGLIPAGHISGLEADLKDEVLEMFRKKTYGHYNLKSFHNARGDASSTAAEASTNGRSSATKTAAQSAAASLKAMMNTESAANEQTNQGTANQSTANQGTAENNKKAKSSVLTSKAQALMHKARSRRRRPN